MYFPAVPNIITSPLINFYRCSGILLSAAVVLAVVSSICTAQTVSPPPPPKDNPEAPEYRFLRITGAAAFISELNSFGRQGFRLERATSIYFDPQKGFDGFDVAATMKRDRNERYEYDWFEAYEPGEVVTRILYRAKQGFYFRDMLRFSYTSCAGCSKTTREKSPTEETLEMLAQLNSFRKANIFILERRIGTSERRDYRVISGILGLGKKPTEELQKQLDDKTTQGFRPAAFIVGSNPPSILLEKAETGSDSGPNAQTEYRVVRTDLGLDGLFRKRVNRLAKEGFRLLLVNESHAVMSRTNGDRTPVTYEWLSAADKRFSERVAAIPNRGFRFHSIAYAFHSIEYHERNLIFEGRAEDLKKPSVEYQVHKMPVVNEGEIKEFVNLAKRGFVVRELFFGDGVYILVE